MVQVTFQELPTDKKSLCPGCTHYHQLPGSAHGECLAIVKPFYEKNPMAELGKFFVDGHRGGVFPIHYDPYFPKIVITCSDFTPKEVKKDG